MRILLLIQIVMCPIGAVGATYETVDGQQVALKKTDGTLHTRSGNIGPGRNLRWVALQDTDLRRGNLSFADLRNGNLEQSDLRDANLHGAVLGGVTLKGANLCGCDLSGAQLNGADIRGVLHWDQADWKGARYERDSEPRWPNGFSPSDAGIIVEQRR